MQIYVKHVRDHEHRYLMRSVTNEHTMTARHDAPTRNIMAQGIRTQKERRKQPVLPLHV